MVRTAEVKGRGAVIRQLSKLLFIFIFLGKRGSYVAKDGLKLTLLILLPLLSDCWDHRCILPHLASGIFMSADNTETQTESSIVEKQNIFLCLFFFVSLRFGD